MKIYIENGVTVIKTGDAEGGTKNKLIHKGLSTYNAKDGSIKYKAEITVSKKKYYLGLRNTVEEAAKLRREAEEQVKSGTFTEWYNAQKLLSARNNHKFKGISERNQGNRISYQVALRVNGTRHYIGNRRTSEEAQALVMEAHEQIDNGTFLEWLAEIKKGQG